QIVHLALRFVRKQVSAERTASRFAHDEASIVRVERQNVRSRACIVQIEAPAVHAEARIVRTYFRIVHAEGGHAQAGSLFVRTWAREGPPAVGTRGNQVRTLT